MSDHSTNDDQPFAGDRGWKTLALSRDEKVTWAGVLAFVGLLLGAVAVGGLPGFLVVFVILTFVILGALLWISMG